MQYAQFVHQVHFNTNSQYGTGLSDQPKLIDLYYIYKINRYTLQTS